MWSTLSDGYQLYKLNVGVNNRRSSKGFFPRESLNGVVVVSFVQTFSCISFVVTTHGSADMYSSGAVQYGGGNRIPEMTKPPEDDFVLDLSVRTQIDGGNGCNGETTTIYGDGKYNEKQQPNTNGGPRVV